MIDKRRSSSTSLSSTTSSSSTAVLNQQSRIAAIESAFNQLKSENSELQQTIALLRSDVDSVQLALVQLCDLQFKLEESQQCNSRLTAENTELRNTVADLKTESIELQSVVSNLSNQVELINKTTSLVESGITVEQDELNTNIIVRGVKLSTDTSETELLSVYSGIRTHLGI